MTTLGEGWHAIRFHSLEEFIEEIEAKWAEEAKKVEERFEEASKDSGSDPFMDELYSEDWWRYTTHFPGLVRESMVITVASSVEFEMRSMANRYGRRLGTELKVQDFDGAELEKCKTYLTKVLNLRGFLAIPEWAELLRTQKVRNVLVHAGGYVTEPKLREYVDQSPHLKVEPDVSRIHVEATFVPHQLDTAKKVFASIVAEAKLDKKLNRL